MAPVLTELLHWSFCDLYHYFLLQDYFDIVKKPMDMSTIKRKLDTGQYKDPWEYVDDVWLMFENAWLYNRKTSRVYKYCSKVSVPIFTQLVIHHVEVHAVFIF